MESCFLTVIIPVYNAAGYLAQTLDSLLRQDISDYEILCINDGSRDRSGEILDDYSRANSHVRVIHQENGGVAAARNRGLENARGEFIWFVDADDLVAPNCLGMLRGLLLEHRCQRLSFGGYTFLDELSREEQEQAARGALPCNVPWQDSVVWRNLLDREFLLTHGLNFRYPEITHGEDGLFMFEVAREMPATLDIPDILYFYRTHAQSAETGADLPSRRKRLKSHLRVTEVLADYYRRDGGENAANRLMAFLWYTLYETAAMPRQEAAPVLARLKAAGLYPGQIPPACTLRKTFLVEDSGPVGRVLEFLCAHLHRPWGYWAVRLLRWVKGSAGK